MAGPAKNTQLIDIGGAGECGWKAASLLLAMCNCKWEQPAHAMATALRWQATNYLLNVNKAWQESGCQDDRKTTVAENGPVASALEKSKESLARERLWICHFGWQSICELKSVVLTIWECRHSGWRKIAHLVPAAYVCG